jgi:hypothetical protein
VDGTSVIASTPIATAAATPTCECIIRDEAGADQNDCCQCSEGNSKHGLVSLSCVRIQRWTARSDPRPMTAFNDERTEA